MFGRNFLGLKPSGEAISCWAEGILHLSGCKVNTFRRI